MRHSFSERFLGWLPGLFIGLIAFTIVIPTNVVDPSNIGWLGIHEDTRTYFLGWDFYRKSPWQFPISANPNYGMEISGSIFMTDTVPLLAIPFKVFHSLLPKVFQYHGIWLLACFVLQGVFGWKLSTLITKNFWQKTAITALFLFQLPFLSRALGHLPLMGHFFILAALLICLQKRENFTLYWIVLVAGAACTNAYLLLMVLGLWFSDCVRRNMRPTIRWRVFLLETVALLLLTLFFCWQVGYFSVGGGVSAAGNPYGLYRFNLLSPIDSNGWSLLLKDIKGGAGDGEGFSYLGLGFIFLIIAAGLSLLQVDARNGILKCNFLGNPYLIVVLSVFVIYAVTNHIGIGPYSVIIPLPEFLSKFTSIFRGAGRLVWPALYFCLVMVVFIICRNYTARATSIILGLAMTMQIADSSAGWMPQKSIVASAQSSTWNLGMNSPFWREAGKHYHAVRRLPAGNVTPDWSVIGAYAASHEMRTDSIYLARVNYPKLEQLNQRNRLRVEQGDYEQDALYIISNQLLPSVLRKFKFDQDLIASVDGYIVVAPQWYARSTLRMNAITPSNFMDSASQGVSFNMTSRETVGVRSLLQGWDSEIGDGGVWSNGSVSVLQFPVQEVNFNSVVLSGTPLVSAARPSLAVGFSVNGEPRRIRTLNGTQSELKFNLLDKEKSAIVRDGNLTITLTFDDVASPKTLGINNDNRLISFAIKRASFE